MRQFWCKRSVEARVSSASTARSHRQRQKKQFLFSSPPAFGRPTLDETGRAAVLALSFLIRRHRGGFFYGAEEPVV